MLHNRENMNKLRTLFLDEIQESVGDAKEVAVALSAGIDSNTIMFGLLALGVTPVAYSFHVDGIMSTDFRQARYNAKQYDVDFVEIRIPTRPDLTKITNIIGRGCYKKTDVECIYPFLYLLPEVKQSVLLTGYGADGHFCISKKGMIHYRHSLKTLQAYRDEHYLDPRKTKQITTLKTIAKEYEITLETPYNHTKIIDHFYNKTWDELNRPTQKQPLRTLFPEYPIKQHPHTNLQCGDSNIREIFEPLLKTKLNTRKRTRMIDLYRDLYKDRHNG